MQIIDEELSDEELVRIIQTTRNQEAMNRLLFRYDFPTKSLVRSKLFRLRSRWYDEEEFVQLIRYATMRATENYQLEKGNFYGYWFRVATRAILSELRRIHNKTNSLEIGQSFLLREDCDFDWFENLDAHQTDTQGQLYYEEQLQKIQEISDLFLTPYEKAILSYHLSGYTYEEMAQKLKTKTKTIDNSMVQIRRKLKQYL